MYCYNSILQYRLHSTTPLRSTPLHSTQLFTPYPKYLGQQQHCFFYQDCISNLSRAPFITAPIHHSVRVSGDAGCHYPSSDHLIPLPSGIFSSCLIGKQTNWSKEKEKKKNSTHKAKTISCQVLPCFNFTDI